MGEGAARVTADLRVPPSRGAAAHLVVCSGRAGAPRDERDGKHELPPEAALGPVDPLEEPCGGDLTHPRRVLVDHGQGRPESSFQREVTETDKAAAPRLDPSEG